MPPLISLLPSSFRRRGGIEPLHVSMPRELKSRPGTSPTHPGMKNNFIQMCRVSGMHVTKAALVLPTTDLHADGFKSRRGCTGSRLDLHCQRHLWSSGYDVSLTR